MIIAFGLLMCISLGLRYPGSLYAFILAEVVLNNSPFIQGHSQIHELKVVFRSFIFLTTTDVESEILERFDLMVAEVSSHYPRIFLSARKYTECWLISSSSSCAGKCAGMTQTRSEEKPNSSRIRPSRF
jgi:hypothetical protein